MSQFIQFYFTSSMLNMFQILIHPSSGACDFSVVSPHWLHVLISTCAGVSVWLVGVVSVWQAEAQLVLQPATRIPLHRQEPANFFCITTLVVCSYFDMCWSFGVAGWGGIRVAGWSTSCASAWHTETPAHFEIRTRNQCGDTTQKSQAPDDGCINVWNMLSIEEVK